MGILNFKVVVRGLSWKEFYTLGFTAYKDTRGFEVTFGLIFIEFQLCIGDPL